MNKRVFETPWFAIEEIPARPEWNMGEKPFYQLVGPDHVLTVPATADGRLLMVRQYRPARGGFTLEFPAGGVDGGEGPLAAAQREMLEETGYGADTWISLGSSGLANQREAASCHVFAALGVKQIDIPREKGIEPVLVTPAEIIRLIRDNHMDMLVSMGAVFFAQAKLGDQFPIPF